MKKNMKSQIIHFKPIVLILITLLILIIYRINSQLVSKTDQFKSDSTLNSELIINNINYNLPTGWTVEKRIEDFIDNTQIEVISVINNDYRLDIGTRSTGISRCDEYYNPNPNEEYLKQLSNNRLSNLLFRQTPKSGLIDGDFIKLDICSEVNSEHGITYGTIIGDIIYLIPVKYDINILNQMDDIVESISL